MSNNNKIKQEPDIPVSNGSRLKFKPKVPPKKTVKVEEVAVVSEIK
jgi:hypothetical protein